MYKQKDIGTMDVVNSLRFETTESWVWFFVKKSRDFNYWSRFKEVLSSRVYVHVLSLEQPNRTGSTRCVRGGGGPRDIGIDSMAIYHYKNLTYARYELIVSTDLHAAVHLASSPISARMFLSSFLLLSVVSLYLEFICGRIFGRFNPYRIMW